MNEYCKTQINNALENIRAQKNAEIAQQMSSISAQMITPEFQKYDEQEQQEIAIIKQRTAEKKANYEQAVRSNIESRISDKYSKYEEALMRTLSME